MIIVRNLLIPVKGYNAMALWPFIFVRQDARVDAKTINHELIHGRQQVEMLVVPFYVWYLIEWLIRLFGKGKAYRNISFEREAYENETDDEYLENRRAFAWIHYINK